MHTLRAHVRTMFYGAALLTLAVNAGLQVIIASVHAPTAVAAAQRTTEQAVAVDRAFLLDIPQLSLSSPVIKDVSGTNDKEYLKALEGGVAHMAGSELPGQAGNTFIFGHSDYYWYAHGDYKEVFQHLDQLKAGDRFTLWYENTPYTYEVFESKIVEVSDWTIADPTPDDPDDMTLTLMTCWPPGTLEQRLAVFAKVVPSEEPKPAATTLD